MVKRRSKKKPLPRDMQRRKVYNADDQWEEVLKKNGWRRQFIDFEHIKAYAEGVYRWVRDNTERLDITVPVVQPRLEKKRRGSWSHAFADGRVEIASAARFRKSTWTDHLVLHELAHLWVPNGIPAHGWQWAALYLKLVERWMGKEPAAELKRHFRSFRVKHHPPRVLSPERKAELSERMKLMRQAADEEGDKIADRTAEIGRTITIDPSGGKVIDLMAALKESLANEQRTPSAPVRDILDAGAGEG